jgi:methylated-DNA-[protein]-cysteine S-methyltransferase
MSNTLKYAIINTAAGWVGILSSPRGLLKTTLPEPSAEDALKELGEDVAKALESPDTLQEIADSLMGYYYGEPIEFHYPLDLSRATAFQRLVWEAARTIPYGETRSYGWVTKQIGKPHAARAVGQALGRNPLLIVVPCHRVIAGDGSLGGFGRSGTGLEIKSQLLELERRHQYE